MYAIYLSILPIEYMLAIYYNKASQGEQTKTAQTPAEGGRKYREGNQERL